ncbi:ribosome silencing factor [Derxia gummosa]|uniref:Ribosome silencing factor n=1 Tax=Derxia gummosa DSM 723 TaxID=1121388 RepID=A0AC36KC02_9BURK
MNITKLQRVIVDALEDVKAQDVLVFNTSHLTSLFDRVVIATGTSNRQTRALAASVRDEVKKAGGEIVSMEGEDTGEWVLVDCGDAVVHLMQPAIRQYYNLEEVWGGKVVRLKSGADRAEASRKARFASEDEPTDEADDFAPDADDADDTPVRGASKSGRSAAAKSTTKPAGKPASTKTGASVRAATTARKVAAKAAGRKTAAGTAACKTGAAGTARKTATTTAAHKTTAGATGKTATVARKTTAAGKTAAKTGNAIKRIVVKSAGRKK